MLLYKITRIAETDYDEDAGYVVRAENPEEARALVSRQHFTSYQIDVWLDSKQSKCIALLKAGKEEIILTDHRAG